MGWKLQFILTLNLPYNVFSFKTLATYLTSNSVWKGDRKDSTVYFSCAWLRLENGIKTKYTPKKKARGKQKDEGEIELAVVRPEAQELQSPELAGSRWALN